MTGSRPRRCREVYQFIFKNVFDPTFKCFYPQYVIYDFNSFMADWGGYMGLVLGYREKLTGSVILLLNLKSYRSYLVF